MAAGGGGLARVGDQAQRGWWGWGGGGGGGGWGGGGGGGRGVQECENTMTKIHPFLSS